MTNRFRVSVYFVDNAYRDDVSRYTSRYHEFETLGAAVEFWLGMSMAKWYEAASKVTGETDRFGLQDGNVFLDRRRKDGKWERIKKLDAVSLLGQVADD